MEIRCPRCGASYRASPGLTDRERHILKQIAAGRSQIEIAAELSVSRSTVQRWIQSAYRCLGARNAVEAVGLLMRSAAGPGEDQAGCEDEAEDEAKDEAKDSADGR